jgi:hypothetical protein
MDPNNRISPFYEFQPSAWFRPRTRTAEIPARQGDPTARRTAFFSSYKRASTRPIRRDQPSADSNGVVPYLETAGKYYMPESFQIISAARTSNSAPAQSCRPAVSALTT